MTARAPILCDFWYVFLPPNALTTGFKLQKWQTVTENTTVNVQGRLAEGLSVCRREPTPTTGD